LPATHAPAVSAAADRTRTALASRPSTETRAPTPRFDGDAISRLPSAVDRAAATRLTAPSERRPSPSLSSPSRRAPDGGSRADSDVSPRLAHATSFRQPSEHLSTPSSAPIRRSVPERIKPSIAPRPSFSRYRDGRYAVYNPPNRPGPRPPYGGHSSHHYDRHDRYSNRYWNAAFGPAWYSPAWYAPVYAYPGSGFSIGWSSRHWGFSFNSYWPAYTASYYATPYYDTWTGGGWGYTSVYSGGWRSGWYGGFSYIYNPWPVYRTYYFYDTEPVVTSTETVYVTQPATQTTYVYNAPTDVATAQPAETATRWYAASAAAQVETEVAGCFCPCHCNGQRPCTCDYPCGAEYALHVDDLDLSLSYQSYAETLNPETIWGSYAGFDKWGASSQQESLFFGITSTEP
jgi:hypothetical protein